MATTTIFANENCVFHLSKGITSSIIHENKSYEVENNMFKENHFGIVYIPNNLINEKNYRNEKNELFNKNMKVVLSLNLKNIDYVKLFNGFLNYINENFKIAVIERSVYSEGEDFENRLLKYNHYYNKELLETENDIDLFNNLNLLLNKLGIIKNIYHFKFSEKDCVFNNNDDFNDFLVQNLEKIKFLTENTGNVMNQIDKNIKFCEIENSSINIFKDLTEFMGFNEYIKNDWDYKKITHKEHNKIDEFFVELHLEAEKFVKK